MIRTTIAGMILTAILLALAGCSNSGNMTRAFMREGASTGHIQTVAVLPFENLGSSPGNAQRAREITMTQFLVSGIFDVVDKSRVDSVMLDEVIEPGAPIETSMLKRLSQRLGAQAFVIGSVQQGSESLGAARFPVVDLTLRLIDAETGLLIWQATGRGSGYSLTGRLFGLDSQNDLEVTLKLLNQMIATIR